MNVPINEHYERLIHEWVQAGEFSSDEEAVQAGLALLEKYQERLDSLRREMKEARESGPGRPFNASVVEDIRRRGRERLARSE
jgi:antitoxin ParD1/3/4